MENKVRIESSRRKKYISMTSMMILNPVLACELLLGIKLTPHERVTLRQIFKGKNIEICAGRGTAKTFLVSVASILLNILLSGRKLDVGIWSGSGGRGSRTIFEEKLNEIVKEEIVGQKKTGISQSICKTKMNSNKYFKEMKEGGYRMELGSSKIISTSVTGNTRGVRVKKIVIDEANTIDREDIQKIIKPASYHKTNVHAEVKEEDENFKKDVRNRIFDTQTTNVGTPGFIYETWTNKVYELMKLYASPDAKEEDFKETFFMHINFLDAYKHDLSIDEMIKDLKSPDVSEEEAKAEILALPITQSMNKFYTPQIMSNVKYDLTNDNEDKNETGVEEFQKDNSATYCIGVDCAYGGTKNMDKMAVILSKRPDNSDEIHIINVWEFDTTDIRAYEKTSNLIKELVFVKFKNIKSVIIDMRGGGDNLKRELYRVETMSPYQEAIIDEDEKDDNLIGRKLIHMFNASDTSNTTLNNYFRTKIGAGLVHFPSYQLLRSYKKGIYHEKSKMFEKIITQFKMIDIEVTKNGSYRFFVPSGKHKDSYSATLYSVYKFMIWDSEVKKKEQKKVKAIHIPFNW